MSDVRLVRDLTAAGLEHDEIRTLVRRGELSRLRRGAYTDMADRNAEEQHRLLAKAAYALAESDSVVSFGSAAVLHGMPISSAAIDRVHLTRDRMDSGRIRPGVHVHVASLTGADRAEIDGIDVTTLNRTFVDVARTSALRSAVAAGDYALRAGMDISEAAEQVERAKRRHGIRIARRAVGLIDARSESVGESFSRMTMIDQGLPSPELQVEIDGPDGFSARVDFLWHEYGVIGEFDGKIKYGRLLRPGESPADAVYREKIREDRLRELGFVVVRWIWDDLRHPARLAARIDRAFQLSRALTRR